MKKILYFSGVCGRFNIAILAPLDLAVGVTDALEGDVSFFDQFVEEDFKRDVLDGVAPLPFPGNLSDRNSQPLRPSMDGCEVGFQNLGYFAKSQKHGSLLSD